MPKYINADEQERIMQKNEMIEGNDWVEVVRCKDCKKAWLKDDKDTVRFCSAHNIIKRKNDFCSYGERKETE